MNGIDHLLLKKAFPFSGARVGFLGHAASVTREGLHSIDALLARPDWSVVRLFGPEHGFEGKGAAGEPVSSGLHPTWNLPVHSLYGENRTPSASALENLDLMVIDIQDLGVRFYTYASTLDNVLRACSQANIPVLILDRPTPLAGIVDGPGLDPDCKSFVGQVALPTVYGWSQGQLASHLKKNLPELENLSLHIIHADDTAPSTWIPPSPAIVSVRSAQIYPMTVWCEAISGVTVERGSPRSFQVWGMQDLPVDALQDVPLLGGHWVETSCDLEGTSVPGVEISIQDLSQWKPITNAVRMLARLIHIQGYAALFNSPGSRPEFFDKLMGTSDIREALANGMSADEICARYFAEAELRNHLI
jgi:uncharacterized protein YbbC (DUF1343 family)